MNMHALLCAHRFFSAFSTGAYTGCDIDFVGAAARPASLRKAAGQKAAQTRKANLAAGKPEAKTDKGPTGTEHPETGTGKAGKAESRTGEGKSEGRSATKPAAKQQSSAKSSAKSTGDKGRSAGSNANFAQSPAEKRTAAKSRTGVVKGGIAKSTRSSRTKV